MDAIRIDPEFQKKIPPLTDEEFTQLQENILRDGEVYEPLFLWQGIIVDGHNRWKIILEHPEIIYHTREMDFPNKWAAFEWMCKKQLGRRNLTSQQRTALIGETYLSRKNSAGGQPEIGETEKMHMEKSCRLKNGMSMKLGYGLIAYSIRMMAICVLSFSIHIAMRVRLIWRRRLI